MMNRFNDKTIKWKLLPLALIILFSCAKTVTEKERPGNSITFSITFKSPPSFTTFDYYIIYASSPFNPNINQTQHYFFIPGKNELNQTAIDVISGSKTITYFYREIFQYWDGAIQLKPNNIDITSGPFSPTSTINDHEAYQPSPISISNYSVSNATITFTVPKTALGIANELYFSVVTSRGHTTNNIQDLIPTIQSIDIITNIPPLNGENDTSSFNPEDPANIESWTVTVQ